MIRLIVKRYFNGIVEFMLNINMEIPLNSYFTQNQDSLKMYEIMDVIIIGKMATCIID